jgi:hypothetical protein
MRMSHTRQALLMLALAGGSLTPPAVVRAADDANNQEVTAFVITHWDGGCDADERDDWDNMVRAWYDNLQNDAPAPDGHGPAAYTIGWLNNDGYIADSHFVDPDNRAWGDDVNYADNADAFMVGFHGGNNGPDHRWIGYVKYDEPGSGNCYLYQGHIELGDGDLEFLHLSSCYSMDREDWWNEWNSSFDGLHQIDGFHGLMWIGEDLARYYRRFADDSFWISIADSWMDNLYVADVSDSYDQCPVARDVGTDASDARDRLNTERYNVVFADPPGLGQSRSHRARYIRGCAPDGKEALPQ